ncbi:MAG: zinc finger domain-containing protein [Candidatus Aenigmatarchaeota archaeon]
MMFKCSTCKVNVLAKENFVKFECPSCGEALIVRCSTCKALSNKYTCPKCGFTGP